MNKYLKKLSLLLIVLLFTISPNVNAAVNNGNKDIYKKTAINLINSMNSDKIIEDEIPLYDANGSEDYFLYNLDHGYIIVSKINNEVCEFSLKSENKFYTEKGRHYIYGGPLEYYEENNNKVFNLKTKIEEKNIESLKTSLTKVKNKYLSNSTDKTLNATSSSTALHEVRIAGQLPNYDYNPNGVCGSCAVGNLLKFMALNVNSAFVPQKYADVAPEIPGVRLIKSIVPYIEGPLYVDPTVESGGSNSGQLRDGFERYLREQVGYSGFVYLNKSSVGPTITQKGLPYVLGLYQIPGDPATADNFYKNHWVVGVSYVYLEGFPNTAAYFGVIDGWGSNDVYVKAVWTDVAVWIG